MRSLIYRLKIGSAFRLALLLGGLAHLYGFEDFDERPLRTGWEANGPLMARLAEHDHADRSSPLQGHFLRIHSPTGGQLFLRPQAGAVNFLESASIRFWARSPAATPEIPLTVELRIQSRERDACFWRKVRFDGPVWRQVELPLKMFRHSEGAFLDWGEVERIGWMFRGAGSLDVDSLELLPAKAPSAQLLSPQDLNGLAFKGEAQVHTSEHFSVVTDAPFDPAPLFVELERLHAMIARDFPAIQRQVAPVSLIVFEHRADYQAFWPRMGHLFRAQIDMPESAGFAALGVSTTWCDPAQGTVRPVMLHEACHAALAPVLGLSNSSEWLHEGIANLYQLHWTGQDPLALMKPRFLKGGGTPLSRLCDGGPIPSSDYPQATLLVKWLMATPDRKRRFLEACDEMRLNANTNLARVVDAQFGMTLEALQGEWVTWLREQFQSR